MGHDNELEFESLGALLKHARDSKKLSIEQVSAETKISISNIRTMENDDYDNLPALPFAKGFYGLYAKYLGLDPTEITASFLTNIGSSPRKEHVLIEEKDYSASSQNVSTMAERSSGSPMSTFGFILLLLIILAGALCYYFQINPASYLSDKLRNYQESEISRTESQKSSSSNIAPKQ